VTLGLIATVLALLGQEDITVYFTVMVIAHLGTTLFYVHFNPRARGVLNTVGVIFFAGFLVVVAMKVVEFVSA